MTEREETLGGLRGTRDAARCRPLPHAVGEARQDSQGARVLKPVGEGVLGQIRLGHQSTLPRADPEAGQGQRTNALPTAHRKEIVRTHALVRTSITNDEYPRRRALATVPATPALAFIGLPRHVAAATASAGLGEQHEGRHG